MWPVAIILDGIALESPPEKKFEDHFVRQPGPEEAAGRNGPVPGTWHSPPGAFQSWTQGPYNLQKRGSATQLREGNETGRAATRRAVISITL